MERPDFNKNPKAPERGMVKHECAMLGCGHNMLVNSFQYPYPGQPPRSPETESLTLGQMNEWCRLEVMDQTYRWHLKHDHEFTDEPAINAEVARYTSRQRRRLLAQIERNDPPVKSAE